MSDPAGDTSPSWLRSLTGWPAAGLLLALFALLATTSALRKSATFDEVAHLTAGYTYTAYNDYRLHPENGNLPQRLVALPSLMGAYRFPSLHQPACCAAMFKKAFCLRDRQTRLPAAESTNVSPSAPEECVRCGGRLRRPPARLVRG